MEKRVVTTDVLLGMEIIITNIDELLQYKSDVTRVPSGEKYFEFGKFDSRLKINISLNHVFFQEFVDFNEIRFVNCDFSEKIELNTGGKSKNVFNQFKLNFALCTFNGILFSEYEYENKISFRKCTFNRKLYIKNSTFNKLLEFYDCEFFNSITFNKVNFVNNVVFTLSSFHENILFTYSTFEKLGIFSRTYFKTNKNKKCGIDLSQSIINGNLIFFESNLDNFHAEYIESNTSEYDKAINSLEIIPLTNKRETFRILKNESLKQNNQFDTIKFYKLELQSYYSEIIAKLGIGLKTNNYCLFFNSLADFLILFLNKISNNHKTSWFQGVVFTIIVSVFFYSLTMSFLPNVTFTFIPNLTDENMKAYIEYVNPFIIQFSDADEKPFLYFVMRVIGRIFIGYGIYQTVQAFRKYK